MKMNVWETGQRLKFEQTRWIANLLVYTGKTYIAVASQDKVCIFYGIFDKVSEVQALARSNLYNLKHIIFFTGFRYRLAQKS